MFSARFDSKYFLSAWVRPEPGPNRPAHADLYDILCIFMIPGTKWRRKTFTVFTPENGGTIL